jgi:hypothetical protein
VVVVASSAAQPLRLQPSVVVSVPPLKVALDNLHRTTILRHPCLAAPVVLLKTLEGFLVLRIILQVEVYLDNNNNLRTILVDSVACSVAVLQLTKRLEIKGSQISHKQLAHSEEQLQADLALLLALLLSEIISVVALVMP